MSLKTYVLAAGILLAILAATFAAPSSSHQVYAQEATPTEEAQSKSLSQKIIGTWQLE